MYQIISLLVLCLFALTEARITTCSSSVGYASPANVSITGCDPNAARCPLKRGTSVTIEIDFTVYKPVKSVNAVVHGTVWYFITKSFSMPDADVCASSLRTGVHCPLSSDQGTIHYTASLPVSSSYPSLDVGIKFELQNEDGDNIACLKIPATLT